MVRIVNGVIVRDGDQPQQDLEAGRSNNGSGFSSISSSISSTFENFRNGGTFNILGREVPFWVIIVVCLGLFLFFGFKGLLFGGVALFILFIYQRSRAGNGNTTNGMQNLFGNWMSSNQPQQPMQQNQNRTTNTTQGGIHTLNELPRTTSGKS